MDTQRAFVSLSPRLLVPATGYNKRVRQYCAVGIRKTYPPSGAAGLLEQLTDDGYLANICCIIAFNSLISFSCAAILASCFAILVFCSSNC